MRKITSKKSTALVMLVALVTLCHLLLPVGQALAEVPDRLPPRGTVPNPGTQEQELTNITFPAPYNVFEFVLTCAGCHGGGIDQTAGHFGNWAGTSMASAARDPIFRAVNITINNAILSITGADGAGNVCFRCHSPNGWLSGRFDPQLSGKGDASNMIMSPLLSTDAEGIMCEACHRVIGNVTQKRADLNPNDPAWNMLAGVDDWPHLGNPYPDGPTAGLPLGDSTLQYNDAITYAGKYPGWVNIWASDTPTSGVYTGQTYAVYPVGHAQAGQPAYAPDGTLPLHYEEPIGPPMNGGVADFQAQAMSPEHSTAGGDATKWNAFVRTPQFCGSCHDLTVPIVNHGMPEQRTYTEWHFSAYGDEAGVDYRRCQDCHMPTMKHELSDDAPISVNPDPALAGWYPWAKDRNLNNDPANFIVPGTAFHKFAGANRDLPDIMNLLYHDFDLEPIGAPTGNDPRVFPGMLSHREPMLDRAERNTELKLHEAVDVSITQAPTEIEAGVYQMTVRVTNNAGHRIPSGYPDGRRMWVAVNVLDQAQATVYQSGYYDTTECRLQNDNGDTTLTRAQAPAIDARVSNAVMVYEKLTGFPDEGNPGSYIPAPTVLSPVVLFDNRIPPKGYQYQNYKDNGCKFITFDPATWAPTIDTVGSPRFPEGQNWDDITYTFTAAPGATLVAKAEVMWQTHSREFMEYIKDNDTSTYRPEGPPSIYAPNYPNTPNYLWDSIPTEYKVDLDGQGLRENWGGVAYAAWLATGKGAPFLCDADSTAYSGAPTAPFAPVVSVSDSFTLNVQFSPVTDAEGYVVYVRYGANDATADWDQLTVIPDDGRLTPYNVTHTALNVGKTFGYKVAAYNGDGISAASPLTTGATPTDLPLAPSDLQVLTTTNSSVTLSFFDNADNEDGFIIERQDVPAQADFVEVARVATLNQGGGGGQTWTDNTVVSGSTYNYQVRAYNVAGISTPTLPVQASTQGVPGGTIVLNGTAANQAINLTWDGATGLIDGYLVQRSTTGVAGTFTYQRIINGDIREFSDNLVTPGATYYYRVLGWNFAGMTDPSNTLTIAAPGAGPNAPTNLNAMAMAKNQINLTWTDNSTGETSFIIERRVALTGTWAQIDSVPANTTTYVNGAPNPNTPAEGVSYEYRVYAVDGLANGSAYSNVAQATTPVGDGVSLPLPDFSGTPLTGNSPLTVAFTNATTFTAGQTDTVTYEWSFGDGAVSGLENPSHTYQLPGLYTVSLKATMGGYSNTMVKQTYVSTNPGGAIRVTILPVEIQGTAQWRVDGGAWHNSGEVVSGLTLGNHTVTFSTVANYSTPSSQVVNVTQGVTTDVGGLYTTADPNGNGMSVGTLIPLLF